MDYRNRNATRFTTVTGCEGTQVHVRQIRSSDLKKVCEGNLQWVETMRGGSVAMRVIEQVLEYIN